MQRAVLVLALIACTASVAAAQGAAATEEGGYEVIANAFGFGADIPGCADASKNIREISIDELNIDIREMTTGLDVEYRTYSPGAAHWGQARFTFALSPNDTCLAEWLEAAKAGKNIRKTLTVRLFKSDKTPGRSYSLFDTFPISLTPARSDEDPTGQGMVLTVQLSRVGFDGGSSQSPRNPAPMNGFVVQALGGNDSKPVLDAAWESCTGGALALEIHPASFGADADAKRSYTEVKLRGPMTTSRSWLAEWLNDQARGDDTRLMVGCGRTKGHTYVYIDVFPVSYVFPRMSVTNTTGNVMEEVAIKPIRVELK